jgi:hypothetical protein
MTTARAVTGSTGQRLSAGLDAYDLRPHEDGDTKKVFDERVPVMRKQKLGDLFSSPSYDQIVRHVMLENDSLRLTDEVLVGRNYRSPIKFLDVPGGKRYRQNGALIYEVKG